MAWDWALMIAGIVLIALYGVLKIQSERTREAARRREREQDEPVLGVPPGPKRRRK